LDVLVNNAGGVVQPVYPAANAAHWMRRLGSQPGGVMLSTQLAVDLMGPGGAIVNIASTAGLGHSAHRAPDYVVAKGGCDPAGRPFRLLTISGRAVCRKTATVCRPPVCGEQGGLE
jgi:NADP-dependent 3-hydroxy acid dehydrogenase YdfG